MKAIGICSTILSAVMALVLAGAPALSGAPNGDAVFLVDGKSMPAGAAVPRDYRLDRPDRGAPPEVTRFDLEEVRAAYLQEYAQVATRRTRSELDPIKLPSMRRRALYPMAAHTSLAELAAKYWGLPATRVANIKRAADQPDVYQAGLSNYYNQQWSHAFILASGNVWIWGDADDDFYDNLNGDSGQWESPEGLNGRSASYYYSAGDQYWGDWYVGYASHYIEDVNIVVHTSAPSASRMDLLTKHFAFEDWIGNNLTGGHKLLAAASADPYYYAVTDPKASIRNAAYFTCYWQGGVGKRAWDAYVASGYPTAAGTGNSTLVQAAKEMMIRAVRYTRGSIKYALDRYGQWTSRY
ncbi:MAG: hypothetical protein AB1714_29035 [Acidobacteriota bacterium]